MRTSLAALLLSTSVAASACATYQAHDAPKGGQTTLQSFPAAYPYDPLSPSRPAKTEQNTRTCEAYAQWLRGHSSGSSATESSEQIELETICAGANPQQAALLTQPRQAVPVSTSLSHPPREMISATDLLKFASTVRAYKYQDEFDRGPDLSRIVGKGFTVDIPLIQANRDFANICPGSPWASYSPDTQRFTVHIGRPIGALDYAKGRGNSYVNLKGAPGALLDTFIALSLDCRVIKAKPYAAVSAFGVPVLVSDYVTRFTAITFEVRQLRFNDWEWSGGLSPDQARSASKAMRVRATGHVVAGRKTDQPVECGTDIRHPELTDPVRTSNYGCFVKVEIETIKLIDGASGAVLWRFPQEK